MTINDQVVLVVDFDGAIVTSVDSVVGQEIFLEGTNRIEKLAVYLGVCGPVAVFRALKYCGMGGRDYCTCTEQVKNAGEGV